MHLKISSAKWAILSRGRWVNTTKASWSRYENLLEVITIVSTNSSNKVNCGISFFLCTLGSILCKYENGHTLFEVSKESYGAIIFFSWVEIILFELLIWCETGFSTIISEPISSAVSDWSCSMPNNEYFLKIKGHFMILMTSFIGNYGALHVL